MKQQTWERPASSSMSELLQSQPEALAVAARRGSMEAFELLVTHYEKRLLHFILKKTGDLNCSEDLLQEVFIKTYQNLDKYDPKRPFTTWLYTIAYNHTISYFRSKKNNLPIEDDYVDLNHPGKIVEQHDLKEHIWTKARCLPKGQFDALWLRYAENMSVKEIARIMKKTQVNVKVILFRARKELLKVFDAKVLNDLENNQREGQHALSID